MARFSVYTFRLNAEQRKRLGIAPPVEGKTDAQVVTVNDKNGELLAYARGIKGALEQIFEGPGSTREVLKANPTLAKLVRMQAERPGEAHEVLEESSGAPVVDGGAQAPPAVPPQLPGKSLNPESKK